MFPLVLSLVNSMGSKEVDVASDIKEGIEEAESLLNRMWGRSCFIENQCAKYVSNCQRSGLGKCILI